MRCLFTMFAEDVQLLPDNSFTRLLQDYRQNIKYFPDALKALWRSMDKGGFDPALRTNIPQFNGYLFKNPEALPVTEAQLDLLIQAAEAGWADVEPAIFGTLLERALQPRERHKLGAHYTPRAYVERLVMPTVIEPLREEWEAARTASAILEDKGDESGARKEIESFHRRLCSVRVLDPVQSIGGNFLYVTLEHLKRLEGEVLEYLEHFPGQLGLDMTGGYTVTPQQLLGLEVNPRAAAIADVVLWIGYLQWHFRAHGNANRLGNPILREYGNIKQQDAVLSYSEKVARLDSNGQSVTRWDGHSTKLHPVTGQEVPDESARTIVYDYLNPKPATWPITDFIVGNPPFIGEGSRMREALGDGYVEALRMAYKSLPEGIDLVMYWWDKAASILRSNEVERFGFITTNSIKQTMNRRIMQSHITDSNSLSIVFAVPDHPWVDSADGAAVRISLTIGEKGEKHGRLLTVISESSSDELGKQVVLSEKVGKILADLTIGADVASSVPLQASKDLHSNGMMINGAGFILNQEIATRLGIEVKEAIDQVIKPYANGKDIVQNSRNALIIDLCGLDIKDVRVKYPSVYQHILENVKPERDAKKDASFRENWWLFGRTRPMLRMALEGLDKYIVTPETSKYRFFTFFDSKVIPDHMLIAFALDDPYFLRVLSSSIHQIWSLAAGGDLGGNTPRYNKSRCFDPFPFPAATETQQSTIRSIAEQLDTHRKQRQSLYPSLTITDIYNVLEKLKAGEMLSAKEHKVHELGLVSILLQLHQELDTAVSAAYGWPADLPEEEILERLVALNKERVAEEEKGHIRWLRPEYQNPQGTQASVDLPTKTKATKATAKEVLAWPKTLAEQAQAVQRALQLHERPATAEDLAQQFKPAGKAQQPQRLQQIDSLLQTLHGLGLLRKTEHEQYVK
ncbi:hypothetical protein D770_10055 [Flammeovirgaceae bacterium 311]|nr:hypothetical protein D770_10055 [Flammeovirgaceae bacterium 311]